MLQPKDILSGFKISDVSSLVRKNNDKFFVIPCDHYANVVINGINKSKLTTNDKNYLINLVMHRLTQEKNRFRNFKKVCVGVELLV